jgi:hypothetical protein
MLLLYDFSYYKSARSLKEKLWFTYNCKKRKKKEIIQDPITQRQYHFIIFPSLVLSVFSNTVEKFYIVYSVLC